MSAGVHSGGFDTESSSNSRAFSDLASVCTVLSHKDSPLLRLTGKPIYYDRAKRAVTALYQRQLSIGLVGLGINVEIGQWTDTTAGINGGIDSYYEYLLKAAILFGDRDCARMWEQSLAAINKYLADQRPDGLWYGQADMNTGARTTTN